MLCKLLDQTVSSLSVGGESQPLLSLAALEDCDDAEGVAALFLLVHFLEIHAVHAADIAVVGALEEADQQRE